MPVLISNFPTLGRQEYKQHHSLTITHLRPPTRPSHAPHWTATYYRTSQPAPSFLVLYHLHPKYAYSSITALSPNPKNPKPSRDIFSPPADPAP